MASYGSYNYESTESRALKTIRADSYNKDLAKNIIQLNNNSEYMAQYLRKLQKGVDEANENVIEQITGLVSDIFVLFAGGSDTGLEFGDLKYVFQAIGSLFGFTDEDGDFVPFPINLFNAAWHFFSTYIVPVGNFTEVINLIIDNAIAFILDVFGEIPIIGEALQTFAMWILDLRDNILMPIFNVIQEIIEFFTGGSSIGELFDVVTQSLLSIFSPLKAKNLTGKIEPGNIDKVPLQSLFSGRVNALDAPSFTSLDTLGPLGEFVYDSTVSFKGNEGSAKCICDGFDHELYSNEMSVNEKTEVNLEVQVKYDGVVTSSAPIKLRLALFIEGVEKEIVDIDTVTTGGSGGWLELRGEYRIPEEVDEVRMTLFVSGDATAGTVWFAKPDMNKNYITGIAPIDWIIDLPEALSGLDEFVQWIVDSFMEAIDGIFGDGTPLGEFLETFLGWVDDVFVTMAEAADALWQALGISKILTKIFGPAEDPGLAETEEAVLSLNGRIIALEGSGTMIIHTISGTWTNPTPTAHNLITFVCVNGGDGGSRGSSAIYDTAKGGLSGGYIQKSFYTDELPASVAITIGAGGAGNSATGGGPGGAGQITSFGSLLVGIKGVGAVFKPGGVIPYDTGVAPGNGGSGGFYIGSSQSDTLLESTDGGGGPFAPGGRAGFGNVSSETAGKPGAAAPLDIPSGGGGGGGGSVTVAAFQLSGDGGAGGFPGGAGGGGARSTASFRSGGNGAAGCVYEIRHWEAA